MKKIAVIYWSGTGNTERMAQAIAEKIAEKETVNIKSVEEAFLSDVQEADAVILGCPSMGDEVLEESLMEPFVEMISPELKEKPLLLFGSYGWGDGAWMRDWEERMKGCGAELIDAGLIIQGEPDEAGCKACAELGEKLLKAIA